MKVSVNKLCYGILFVIIVCNNFISSWIPFFRYIDEIIALLSIGYIVLNLKRVTARRSNRVILVCILTMTVIGILGNVVYGYQEFAEAIFKDILAFYKMPMIFIAVYTWSEHQNLKSAHQSAVTISKIYILILWIGCIINCGADIGLSYGIRYGFRTYKFLYTHPTFLVYALVILSVVMVSDQERYPKQNVKYFVLQFMILVSMFFTFRDKGFGYIVLFIILLIFLPRAKKIKIRYFVIAGIIALLVSYQKLVEYKSWSWSQRGALYINGFQLMIKSFPIGSGFGTFNSSLSGEFYSRAYRLFGLENKPGMNPLDYIDLGDAQLPYYYAQFGIIGFALFAIIIITIIKCVYARYKGKMMEQKAAYLMLGYTAIGLLVEAVFTNESGATFVLIIFLYLSTGYCRDCTDVPLRRKYDE